MRAGEHPDLALIGAAREPMPEPEWCGLPNGRKARLTGAAAGLRGADLATYILFAEHADRAGNRMRAGMSRLAAEAGCNRSTIIRARERLKAEGWLLLVRPSRGGITGPKRANPTAEYRVYLSPLPVTIVTWGREGEIGQTLGVPTRRQRKRALNPPQARFPGWCREHHKGVVQSAPQGRVVQSAPQGGGAECTTIYG